MLMVPVMMTMMATAVMLICVPGCSCGSGRNGILQVRCERGLTNATSTSYIILKESIKHLILCEWRRQLGLCFTFSLHLVKTFVQWVCAHITQTSLQLQQSTINTKSSIIYLFSHHWRSTNGSLNGSIEPGVKLNGA